MADIVLAWHFVDPECVHSLFTLIGEHLPLQNPDKSGLGATHHDQIQERKTQSPSLRIPQNLKDYYCVTMLK